MRDEDSHARRNLKVVLVGSAPLMLAQGLSERLAVRFAILHVRHWPFDEMRHAFGWTVEQFIYYGGYPGAGLSGTNPSAGNATFSRVSSRRRVPVTCCCSPG